MVAQELQERRRTEVCRNVLEVGLHPLRLKDLVMSEHLEVTRVVLKMALEEVEGGGERGEGGKWEGGGKGGRGKRVWRGKRKEGEEDKEKG